MSWIYQDHQDFNASQINIITSLWEVVVIVYEILKKHRKEKSQNEYLHNTYLRITVSHSSISIHTIRSIFDPNILHAPALTPYLTSNDYNFVLVGHGMVKCLQCTTKHVRKFSNTKHLFHRQWRDIRCTIWLVFGSSFTEEKDDSYLPRCGSKIFRSS